MFASSAKRSAHARDCPATPSARRRAGLRDQRLERARQRAAHRCPAPAARSAPSRDQLRDRRDARRDAGEPLALRLDQHVRQPVAVAVARDAAREREEVRVAVLGEQLVLRAARRAIRCDRRCRARCARLCRASLQRSAADVHEAPVQLRRQARQRLEQHVGALFLHQARRPTGSPPGRRDCCRRAILSTRNPGRKPREVDAVIDQLDASRRRQRRAGARGSPRCR